MILSCFITNHFISAVLFDTDSFRVVSREYISIPFESDYFSKLVSTSKLKDLIVEKLKMDPVEYDSLKKIAILSRDDDKIESWGKIYTLREIQESVANRILAIDLYDNEGAFRNNKKLANTYANYKFYHKPLTEEILEHALKYAINGYLDYSVLTPNSLKEVILCIEENNDLEADSFLMKKILKLIAEDTYFNQIFEITFDFGYFIIPIIAALLETKTDPSTFFKKNPIHIDYKLLVVPDLDEDLQVLTKDLREISPQNDKIGLKYVEGTDKDIIKVRSKNPKTKLNLEFNGCRYGVYIDPSPKNKND